MSEKRRCESEGKAGKKIARHSDGAVPLFSLRVLKTFVRFYSSSLNVLYLDSCFQVKISFQAMANTGRMTDGKLF